MLSGMKIIWWWWRIKYLLNQYDWKLLNEISIVNKLVTKQKLNLRITIKSTSCERIFISCKVGKVF